METPPPPEFGPNGAVLNSPVMTEALKQDYRGKAPPRPVIWPRRIGWETRILLTIPLLAVWFPSDLAGHAPLWARLAITAAAATFLVRSFWMFDRWTYRLWGAPFALGLLYHIALVCFPAT